MFNKKAFTLLELMVAFSILTIMIISFYPMLMTTNKIAIRAQNNFKTEIMAQNALEEILHQASKMTQVEFSSWLRHYQDEINTGYQDYPLRFELSFPKIQDKRYQNKFLDVKILLDDLILYESQVWLVYETE